VIQERDLRNCRDIYRIAPPRLNPLRPIIFAGDVALAAAVFEY
jgi:hypothetical protein